MNRWLPLSNGLVVGPLWVLVLTTALGPLLPARAAAPELRRFDSEQYVVHTTLDRAEAAHWARHMDAVFREYSWRFRAFVPRQHEPNDLYLFKTRQEYLDFLAAKDIVATNSGGLFVVRGDFSGLFTWTQDKSRSTSIQTLQHEGFHQFAWNFIGHTLPIWVNEGLAQYFEDGILVGERKMHLGLVNERRIALVKAAVAEQRAVELRDLLTMTADQWHQTLRDDPEAAALNYAQSWALCFFLIHGDEGRYRTDFEQYLHFVAERMDSDEAFTTAFRTKPLQHEWKKYVLDLEPDPLTTALSRLEFLGQALRFLQAHDHPTPRTLKTLMGQLQAMRYRMWISSHGIRFEHDARDAENFQYTRPNGVVRAFKLLAPARNDLPPRIVAPGLRPEPMLVWSRDEDDQLVQDVQFR